jgi:hypothetical protein
MEGLHLFKARDPKDPKSTDVYVHAMKAHAEVRTEEKEFRLHLYDARFETTGPPGPDGTPGLPKIVLAKESVPVVLPFKPKPDKNDPATLSIAEIRSFMEELEERDRALVADGKKPFWYSKRPNYEGEIHRRFATSLACLAFAFIGIPLGIKARRKDTSTGLILALLIGAAYFLCSMVGGKTTNELMLAAWGPNVACVILGLVLLRRARFR